MGLYSVLGVSLIPSDLLLHIQFKHVEELQFYVSLFCPFLA